MNRVVTGQARDCTSDDLKAGRRERGEGEEGRKKGRIDWRSEGRDSVGREHRVCHSYMRWL